MKRMRSIHQRIFLEQKKIVSYSLLLLLLSVCTSAYSASDSLMASLFDMSLEELMNQEVTIATKSAIRVKQAPSVVSVITREEIENLPVRNLSDLLQLIPGFEITPRVNAFDGVGFRGVKDTRYTSRYLILLDGQPHNHIFYGNSLESPYGGIDLNSIEKIEIIRGPGSALYGKNAFLAVINIITKTAEKSDLTQVKGEYGSFNSYRAYAAYGKKAGLHKNYLLSMAYQNSDGTNTQGIDEFGRLQNWNEKSNNLYLNSNLALGNLSFYVSGALAHNGTSLYDSYLKQHRVNYSANYGRQLNDLIKLKATLFGHNEYTSQNFEQYPENDSATFLPPSPLAGYQVRQVFPNGFYYSPVYSEYNYGANLESELLFSKKHQMLTGIQMNAYGVYDTEFRSNFNFRTRQYYRGYTRDHLPLDTVGWFDNNGHHYTNMALYVQDIWYPITDVGITVGGRLDLDSEIGLQFNPRLGINWLLNDLYTLKLLYGSAYRAPSPSEQYQTLGYAFGNKDLKPETIHTLELAFQQDLPAISNQINLFYNVIDGMIYAETNTEVVPGNIYNNLGTNTSYGIEFASNQKLSHWLYTFVNLAFNTSENTTTIDSVKKTFNHVDVSPFKINAGANLQLPYNLRFSATLSYRSKMEKFKELNNDTGLEEDVSKDLVGNYTVINAKLVYKKDKFPLSVYLSCYNVLNTEYYSQDNEQKHYPPMPGISYLAGVSFTF